MNPLNKHFLIARDATPVPDDWKTVDVGGWRVSVGQDVRRYDAATSSGAIAGALFGWVVGEDGVMPDGARLTIPDDAVDPCDWAADLCGRFIALFGVGDDARFCLDAGGLLGAVYSPRARAIASTPNLLPAGADDGDDAELRQAFGLPMKQGWYPFGLTPRLGVTRLMPNHVLSMGGFDVERTWPGPDAIPDVEPEDGVARLYRMVQTNAGRIARHRPVSAHLTAGYDSRMVLAALKPVAAELPLVTILLPGTNADLDVQVASKIAKRFGLRHEQRAFVEPTAADMTEWFERTGNCVSDQVARLGPTLDSWDQTEVQLTGACGEVGRAFYWKASDVDGPRPSAEDLLARFGAPAIPRTVEAGARWLATLPEDASATLVWDLAYIEQRLGCWAGPAVFGSRQPIPSLSPYNSREVFALMLGLPAPYRLSPRMCTDFIAEAWPELNAIPFNRPAGFDKLRFAKYEAKAMLPAGVKSALKQARRRYLR